MTLSNGRHMLAIPGPSVMPDRVLQAMHQPAPDIYGGLMVDVTLTVTENLKKVACTQHNVALYIANGHGVWEAAFANLIAKGDKVLCLSSGRFGQGWAEIAKSLGAEIQMLDWGQHKGLDLDELERALKADKSHDIKVLSCTHVDTSSSIRYDISAIRKCLDELNHPALLAVDCIASLACDRFEMDKWGVDVMVAASQKGLMTPPGMGFVFFSDKAAKKRDELDNVSPYWDWKARAKPDIYYQRFFGTAPTHHLFGLHEALKMILDEEGLEAVWKRHETLANMIWAAMETWAEGGALSLNVANHKERSWAVTAAKIEGRRAEPMRKWLTENVGLTLGLGIGMVEFGDPEMDSYFRIGHMGHINAHMLLGTLSSIEAGLGKFDIAHGAGGVTSAMGVLSKSIE